ncbi:transposase [Streptomyces celluloflavus]|uniref:transposase n=1 Tax=Streptomyces celluloflavus TaxID=58344 RepID=UPI003F4D6EE5
MQRRDGAPSGERPAGGVPAWRPLEIRHPTGTVHAPRRAAPRPRPDGRPSTPPFSAKPTTFPSNPSSTTRTSAYPPSRSPCRDRTFSLNVPPGGGGAGSTHVSGWRPSAKSGSSPRYGNSTSRQARTRNRADPLLIVFSEWVEPYALCSAILVGRASGVRTDLVPDDLWERVVPLVPPAPERRRRYPGRLRVPDRAALAGIMYALRTGVAWRDVPAESVDCSGVTAWRRLRDWTETDDRPRLHGPDVSGAA